MNNFRLLSLCYWTSTFLSHLTSFISIGIHLLAIARDFYEAWHRPQVMSTPALSLSIERSYKSFPDSYLDFIELFQLHDMLPWLFKLLISSEHLESFAATNRLEQCAMLKTCACNMKTFLLLNHRPLHCKQRPSVINLIIIYISSVWLDYFSFLLFIFY